MISWIAPELASVYVAAVILSKRGNFTTFGQVTQSDY